MKKNNIPILIGISIITATATAVYFFKRKRSKEKSIELKSKANELFKNKNYLSALDYYLKSISYLNPGDDIYNSLLNNISLCYFLLNDYIKSIEYSTQLLKIDKLNLKVLRRRADSHKFLGLKKDMLYDLYVCCQLDKQFEGAFKSNLEDFCKEEAKFKIKNKVPHKSYIEEFMKPFGSMVSQINYRDFQFESLYSSSDQQDLIKKYNLTENQIILLKTILEIVKGDYESALKFIENKTCIFFKLLRAYIQTIQENNISDTGIIDELIEEILNFEINTDSLSNNIISDPFLDINDQNIIPLLYCAAFIRSNSMDIEKIIEKGLKTKKPEIFYSIKFAINVNNSQIPKAISIIEKLDDSIQSYILKVETFLNTQNYKKLDLTLDEMAKKYPLDPRTNIYFAMKYEKQNDYKNMIIEIDKSIEKDPTYFNSRLFKANYYFSKGEDDLKLFNEALACATRYEEFISILQYTHLIEIKNKFVKDFPEMVKSAK